MVRDNRLEASGLFELVDRAYRQLMLQPYLRRRNHQRLPEISKHLPPQNVKIVRRHRWLGEAEIDVEGVELFVGVLTGWVVHV